MAEKQTHYLRQLRDQIAKSFDEEDLRALVFDLDLDWDELQGTRKTTRVQDLIVQLGRNGHLEELVDLLREKRPHLSWPEPPPPEQQRQVGRELPLLAGDGETANTFPKHKSKHYIGEWRFGGIPQQLGTVVSTYAELRPGIHLRVTPKSDGRVRVDFTRQVDFTDPRDRIVAQGWAIVQSLPYGESMVHLFALNPKHWPYLEPVWDEVVVELKRQGWTVEKIASEIKAAVSEQLESAAGNGETAVSPPWEHLMLEFPGTPQEFKGWLQAYLLSINESDAALHIFERYNQYGKKGSITYRYSLPGGFIDWTTTAIDPFRSQITPNVVCNTVNKSRRDQAIAACSKHIADLVETLSHRAVTVSTVKFESVRGVETAVASLIESEPPKARARRFGIRDISKLERWDVIENEFVPKGLTQEEMAEAAKVSVETIKKDIAKMKNYQSEFPNTCKSYP